MTNIEQLEKLSHIRLLARGMELPEDTFVNTHNFDASGETWGTFIYLYTIKPD